MTLSSMEQRLVLTFSPHSLDADVLREFVDLVPSGGRINTTINTTMFKANGDPRERDTVTMTATWKVTPGRDLTQT